MAVRRMLAGFAVLALGIVPLALAPLATALPPCSHKACDGEVAASGLSGNARAACFKQVIADCKAGACSCTGASPPCSCVCGDSLCGPSEDCATCPRDCGTCPTTTTTIPPGMCGNPGFPPTCNLTGPCPSGEFCFQIFEGGSPACRCFAAGQTPCSASGFPACGGACLDGRICQAWVGSDGPVVIVEICSCVDPTLDCSGQCGEPALCPPGDACWVDSGLGCGCFQPP